MEQNYQLFFALLRAALADESFEAVPTEAEWNSLYHVAQQQSLIGVVYSAVTRLPREQQPPMMLAIQWASEAETIRGLNSLLNSETTRVTKVFTEAGRRTAILKGQANARFYPDPMSRQPGDIDIWVEGGQKSVKALLKKIQKEGYNIASDEKENDHHIHLSPNEKGVTVEVHFRPSSGNSNPITNKRLQNWMEQEILKSTMVSEGFYVPSVKFALVMQLAHIQHHFFYSGVGLRQICDYYLLLQNASDEERTEVAGMLKRYGLRPIAGALMWLLKEVLHLETGLMLCETDAWRGDWLLREIMEGGNFGRYAPRAKHGIWRGIFLSKWRRLKMLRFNFWEVLWTEVRFWKTVIKGIPKRIRTKTLFLSKT